MNAISDLPPFLFARWDADDALDALHQAGLDIDHVEQARWPASAPQPRTQRQAFTFRSPGVVDPHLLLIFDSAPALEVWRLWLARYWKARPYLSIHDNVLLLVSRDLSERDALAFHDALGYLGHQPARPAPTPPTPVPAEPPQAPPQVSPAQPSPLFFPSDTPRA
jgi:hypothetical protein